LYKNIKNMKKKDNSVASKDASFAGGVGVTPQSLTPRLQPLPLAAMGQIPHDSGGGGFAFTRTFGGRCEVLSVVGGPVSARQWRCGGAAVVLWAALHTM
jgi:hypothetical protein